MSDILKQDLWRSWRVLKPSEWDGGQNRGGGLGSQRFWEYFWTISRLPSSAKIFADVGSGETDFLPWLMRRNGYRVDSIDPLAPLETGNLSSLGSSYRMLLDEFLKGNDPDAYMCVTCVSVAEHLPDPTVLFRDLAKFRFARIVCTLELGPDPQAFDWQLTMGKLYGCLESMRDSHYLSEMESCPVWADNSSGGRWRPFGIVLEPIR